MTRDMALYCSLHTPSRSDGGRMSNGDAKMVEGDGGGRIHRSNVTSLALVLSLSLSLSQTHYSARAVPPVHDPTLLLLLFYVCHN